MDTLQLIEKHTGILINHQALRIQNTNDIKEHF